MSARSSLALRRQSSEYHPLSPLLARTNSSASRRSSAAYSPVHSRLGSSHGPGDSLANELGDSLADELGEWDEEDDEDLDEDDEDLEDDDDEELHETEELEGVEPRERDSGIDITSSPLTKDAQKHSALPTRSLGHRRKGSDYNGSEYGSESDFEESQLINASLEARLAEIEALARRGTGDTAGMENVIVRATKQFKDLGGQSGIETGVTR
jgi:hypothetical protein